MQIQIAPISYTLCGMKLIELSQMHRSDLKKYPFQVIDHVCTILKNESLIVKHQFKNHLWSLAQLYNNYCASV